MIFSDDTCLLIKNKSLKKIKKQLNIDLRNCVTGLKQIKFLLMSAKQNY